MGGGMGGGMLGSRYRVPGLKSLENESRAKGTGRPADDANAEEARPAMDQAKLPRREASAFGRRSRGNEGRAADKNMLGDLSAFDGEQSMVFFDSDGDGLVANAPRDLYRQPEKTREWAENNYHHRLIAEQNAELITVNAFWLDYARHQPGQPFVSRHFAEASRNFPEMLLALAVLDLPWESPRQTPRTRGRR